ncbi:MAG: globin family protein [Thermoleophilia bacterium]
MNSLSLAKVMREKQDEIIRQWLDNLEGHIADDFLQMLSTPMGTDVASKLLAYLVEYLKAEEYERADVMHRMREAARDASFRRSAVGFGLPDIVFTALTFRRSVQEILLNNIVSSGVEEELLLLDTVMTLNRLGDQIVTGEIAGYFAFHEYRQEQRENRGAA